MKSEHLNVKSLNILMNSVPVFFCFFFQNLADSKCSFGEENVRKNANALIEEALSNSDPILRCAAGEALGRMAQVVNDPAFVARMAQRSFEKCQKTPDAMVRTGHALALGCLHRYVGGMESGQHLRNSVSILIALAKDESSSLVQVFYYFFIIFGTNDNL